jgi:hypothetical protein
MWAGSWGAPLKLATINLMAALYRKKYAVQKDFKDLGSRASIAIKSLIINKNT